MITPPPTTAGTVAHAVALYLSDDDLRGRVLPFLREGLDRGDDVIAVVTGRAERALRAGLGGDGDAVRWRPPGLAYRPLGGLLDGIGTLLAERRAAGSPTRLLMENDVDGDRHRHAAHLRIEAAANHLLAGYDSPCTCLYDRRRYPRPVLDAVARVHPRLLDPDGGLRDNPDYVEPAAYLAAHAGPLSPVPPDVALDVPITALDQLRPLRHRIADTGRALGLPAEACGDLQLAANEVLTNALRHGTPPARIRIWRGERSVVARVDDRGTAGERVATAGFRRPGPSDRGGFGLWVARRLTDVVHVAAGPDGTGVELHLGHPGRGGGPS